MDKKTVLAIFLCMGIFLAWQVFITPPPALQDNATRVDNSSKTSQVSGESNASEALQAQNIELAEELAPVEGLSVAYEVSTNLLNIYFDNATGDIKMAAILGWKDEEGDPVTFNKGGGTNYYRLLTPLASGYALEFKEVEGGKEVTYKAEKGALTVIKRYILSNDSYLITTQVIVENRGESALSIPFMVKVGPNLGGGFEPDKYVFEGAMISSAKATESLAASKDKVEELPNPLWGGYTSKYFLFAAAGGEFESAKIAPAGNGEEVTLTKNTLVNSGDIVVNEFQTFVGPKSYNELKATGLGLQSSIDFGWFYFLAIPMLEVLIYFYGLVHNYGIAIIILTILVKILTLPLTLKGMKSMKAMSKLQPKMLELKEKFKNEPQKLNVATMELYKEHGVNPMSGCLPLLIQIPIFFALYKALLVSVALKDAPFFLWITDLSSKDPYYITPIIMGITMFIQQKMTPTTADPIQQKIFLAMPVIFTVLFVNFPSGLVIYWLTNNVLSIIQQYIVNKKSA